MHRGRGVAGSWNPAPKMFSFKSMLSPAEMSNNGYFLEKFESGSDFQGHLRLPCLQTQTNFRGGCSSKRVFCDSFSVRLRSMKAGATPSTFASAMWCRDWLALEKSDGKATPSTVLRPVLKNSKKRIAAAMRAVWPGFDSMDSGHHFKVSKEIQE